MATITSRMGGISTGATRATGTHEQTARTAITARTTPGTSAACTAGSTISIPTRRTAGAANTTDTLAARPTRTAGCTDTEHNPRIAALATFSTTQAT